MRRTQGIRARSIIIGALAGVALLLAGSAGAQDSPRRYSLTISLQPLTLALEAFSGQTGINYGYSPQSSEEEELQVGPLIGEYTADEALTLLLQSTGLRYSWINSSQIAIVSPPAPTPKVETKRSRSPRAARREELEDDGIIDHVVTEASKYRYLPAPAAAGIVLERKAIERTGAQTVMGLLKILTQQPFLRSDGFRSNGAQYAELRGLGPDTTLVLINGQRASASAASFSFNAFDLNQLPLSAVERVEVQLDSISVRHGADAIGGILNIVLRDDIAEPGVDARYGAANGGGEEHQGALSAGYQGANGRAAVILDFRDVAPLFGVERDLWRDQDYRRFGSSDQRTIVSSPGNVMALPGHLLPGLDAPFAAIPGQPAGPGILSAGFLPFQLNRTSLLQYSPIVIHDRRVSAVGSAQANVTPDLIAAADLMIVDRSVLFESTPPVVPGAIVPQTNPYNSFGEPVMVFELLDHFDPLQMTIDSLLIRGAASLRGKVNGWDWQLSLLRSAEDARQRIDNVLDPVRLQQVLADPDPQRTLNLLGPGPAASREVIATVLAPPAIDTFAADTTQVMGVVDGKLFALPAGEVTTVLGTEWRKEAVQFASSLGSFDRNVAGAFAELHVPVLSARPAAQELTLTAAGRFDHYSDFGKIFSPQYGLVWKPLRDVQLRATHGRSFRAPSLYDLYLPRVPLLTPIADPRRNGEAYTTTVLGGGARDLKATRGESFTTGIELTPQAMKPLTISATYWRVHMDNRVTALNSTFALMREADLADRVLRAEPTEVDLAAGLPGRVQQIDLTRMNFAALTTSGIDFGAGYAFETAVAGRFAPDLKATWIDEYEALDLPGMPPTDRVSVANPLGTIAKWRAVASLDWQRGALGATTYVRYIPSYDDSHDGVRNGRTVRSQTFLDLQFSVDLGRVRQGGALLRGLQFTAGAVNALDQQPHFAEVGGVQGYDTSQGDLKGRFWYLRLGKTF